MAQISSKDLISDFTSGHVLPAMLSFAFPLFLSNLLQAMAETTPHGIQATFFDYFLDTE